jgi:hypothetical protein
MTNFPNISAQDGPLVTINDWLKDPLRVPEYIVNLMNQGFLADAVLRHVGSAPAGVVRYQSTTPLYADSAITDRAEFGEVQVARTSLGDMNVAYSVEKALAVIISDEDQRRSSVDKLQIRMQQVKNTMLRAWDDVFLNAVVTNSGVLSQGISAGWYIAGTDIRGDILGGMQLIESAVDANGSVLGYEADTLIVNRAAKFNIIRSTQFNTEYYGGDIADQNLRYTGKLPQKIMGLNVLVSPRVPANKAILMQSNASGFIADELPLQATPLYRDEPRKVSRSDVQRASAVGIDQPKSVCIIHGANMDASGSGGS